MLSLLVILACTSTGPGGTPDDTGTTGDGGADGGSDGGVIRSVEVEVSSRVPTAALVTWETDVPTRGLVRFGEEGALTLATRLEDEATTQHAAWLVGLPELADGSFQVEVTDEGGQTALSEVISYQTGAFEAGLPRPDVVELQPDLGAGGFTLVPLQFETQRRQWATIIDAQGRVVWAIEVDETTNRMRLSPDGGGIIYFDHGPDTPLFTLFSIGWDGAQRWSLDVDGADQDFDIVDEDTFVVLTKDVVTLTFADGPWQVFNDGIMEVSRDGSRRMLWQALDHIPLDTSQSAPQRHLYEGIVDWAHANFLRYEPDADAVCTTMRHLPAATCVDRGSGQPLWLLGEDLGDFAYDRSSRLMSNPHSVQLVDDGALIFDQGDEGSGECGRAMLLDLDLDDAWAEVTWDYSSEDCLRPNFLGNAQRLDGGNVVVNFGQAGRLDEVTAAGEVSMRLEGQLSNYFLYSERVTELAGRAP